MAKEKDKQLSFELFSNVIETPIEQALPRSMMVYSEHVILDRALPRIEDGLKPVQRRILFTMHSLGMKPNTEYKKSARVVGDCLGKYHPHGDQSVYDAMVRMGQDFNMRNVLIDGQGNFGSIDGDSAAAMRYTEVRLAPLSMELLKDLDKRTIVDWNRNFDDTLEEPDVLPGRFPNLLVNGASGIAIGLATNIPSHNLTEVIDGCIAMLERPQIKLSELLEIIKGPDFPTGGFLVAGQDMYDMYDTGRGKVLLRGKLEIENTEGGKQNIVITEIPFSANKSGIINRIYSLKEVKKYSLENIIDVDDESDRNGMRVVVRLKKGSDAIRILDSLYKNTDLQKNFSANMVAIANGKPRQMGLIPILKYYLEYQRKLIYRRSQYDIGVAKTREHILEGFSIIMPAIDEVISIIRNSSSKNDAKKNLRDRFDLSNNQADAILAIQLGNINKMDVAKFEEELRELRKEISKLTKIISSVREQDRVVMEELIEIRDKYKTKRLTTIINDISDIDVTAFDPTKRTAKKCFAVIDSLGGLKIVSSRNYLSTNREIECNSYKAIAKQLVLIETNEEALIFSNKGYCYKFDSQKIREKQWDELGDQLSDYFETQSADEKAVGILTYKPEEEGELQREIFAFTQKGYVKRSTLQSYIVTRESFQYMKIAEDDYVIGVEYAKENSTIFFISTDGQCVNSETSDIPSQGRIAGGVIVMNLNDGESAVFASQAIVEKSYDLEGKEEYLPLGEIILINDKGYGKRVISADFSPMRRNRKGLRIMDIFNENTKVIFASKVLEPYDVVFVDFDNNIKHVNSEDIRIENKDTKGRPLVSGMKISLIAAHMDNV